MDVLDGAILREYARDAIHLFGGLDPRLSAAEVGQRLGVDRSVIRRRLDAWQRQGLLLRFRTLPSAVLFGNALAAATVHVPRAADKRAVLSDIGLIDGMAHAIDHVGEWIGVSFATAPGSDLNRRVALLERTPGVAAVPEVHHARVAAPTVTPTDLGWRIIEALVTSKREATLAEMAAKVGISIGTFRTHYNRLTKGRAVWTSPELDFSRWEGSTFVRFLLAAAPDADRRQVVNAAKKRVPSAWQSTIPEMGPGRPQIVDLHAVVPCVSAAEDAAIQLAEIPGVHETELLFPKRNIVYAQWSTDRLAERMSLLRAP